MHHKFHINHEPVNEGFKREAEGETLPSYADSFHDARVPQLLCHKRLIKQV